MYGMLIILALSIVLVACEKTISEDYYTFDTAVYDETPNISSDSVKTLFDKGITVKRFEGKDYFINNYHSNYHNICECGECDFCDSIIEFGPITIDDYFDYYDLNITEISKYKVRVEINLKLISRFNKTLYSSEFRPSWVVWTSNKGFMNITNLTPVVINYVNGINEGDYIHLKIYWDTTKDLIDNRNILLSIESINKYGNNKSFREILTFSFNRFK